MTFEVVQLFDRKATSVTSRVPLFLYIVIEFSLLIIKPIRNVYVIVRLRRHDFVYVRTCWKKPAKLHDSILTQHMNCCSKKVHLASRQQK